MHIIEKPIAQGELTQIASDTFGDLVKAVVDIEKKIIAIDAELHADLESLLLNQGSIQNNLWGINLYPEFHDESFIEFDSMINIRPSQNNHSRGVDSEDIQKKIINIVNHWIVNNDPA